MRSLLIAESGGTKTDWCLFENGDLKERFSTNGLHPVNLNEDLWTRIEFELKSRVSPANTELHFYGAGCYNSAKADQMKMRLSQIGFTEVSVFSDLHAAGKALFNQNSGWAAILGTGSVLFEYQGGQITQVIGGKGHLKGDEGSGYYFGKLILEAYRLNNFDEKERVIIENFLGRTFLEKTPIDDKQKVASISSILNDCKKTFNHFHKKNLLLFYECYMLELDAVHDISFSGSYAYFNSDNIKELLLERNLRIGQIISRPIDAIIDQIVAGTY